MQNKGQENIFRVEEETGCLAHGDDRICMIKNPLQPRLLTLLSTYVRVQHLWLGELLVILADLLRVRLQVEGLVSAACGSESAAYSIILPAGHRTH